MLYNKKAALFMYSVRSYPASQAHPFRTVRGHRSAHSNQLNQYSTTQPLQWSSEFHDTELGLVYYYNPQGGRWINRDPIGTEGGYDLYAYVGNNTEWLWDELGVKTSETWDNFWNNWKQTKGKDLSPAQLKWAENQLARGCIGVTVIMLSKNHFVSSACNFDFGFISGNKIIHADMYHNPDKDGDYVGDYYPFPEYEIRESTIFRSTFAEWSAGALMENKINKI